MTFGLLSQHETGIIGDTNGPYETVITGIRKEDGTESEGYKQSGWGATHLLFQWLNCLCL